LGALGYLLFSRFDGSTPGDVGSRGGYERGKTVLVLTRKAGQSVIIGDGIEVTVLSVSGDKVRIGVTADKEVPILRNEVRERLAEEQKKAPAA
jgi:carbon storage regulator